MSVCLSCYRPGVGRNGLCPRLECPSHAGPDLSVLFHRGEAVRLVSRDLEGSVVFNHLNGNVDVRTRLGIVCCGSSDLEHVAALV